MLQPWQFFGVVMLAYSVVSSQPSTSSNFPPYSPTSLNSPHASKDITPAMEMTMRQADDSVYGVKTGNADTNISATVADQTTPNRTCFLSCVDPLVPSQIRHLIDVEKTNLTFYSLVFPTYNSSPLISNFIVYKAESWARASTRHGQTLLSLSFNYGILSLMTLSVGTADLTVPLTDDPQGCIGKLAEAEQFDRVLYLMLRDFQNVTEASVTGEERLCHEAIVNKGGYARFIDMCCYEDPNTATVTCEPVEINIWLRLLQLILSLIRIGILFFGPLLFVSAVVSISRKNFPYMVKLKEPLMKTAVLRQDGVHADPRITAKQHLNLRNTEGFPKLNASAANVPLGKPVPIRVLQYDILVSYKRTLTENSIPVGFWRNIFGAVFRCKLRSVGPFKDCCRADMCWTPGHLVGHNTKWIAFWSKVGHVLMVLLIPSPYYLRLVVFYQFEYDELAARKEATARLGLKEPLNNNPLQYFTPTHPIFLVIYIVYFITAGIIGFTVRREGEGVILRIIAGAFDDLNSLQWTTVLHVMVSNIIWPFKQFGLVSCLVVFVYWPLAVLFSIILYAFYCLPTVYLAVRMLFHSRHSFLYRTTKCVRSRPYRARKRPDNSIKRFEVERFMKRDRRHDDVELPRGDDVELVDLDVLPPTTTGRQVSESTSLGSTVARGVERTFGRYCTHLLASLLCVTALCSSLVILSECIGWVVEVAFFTLMGVFINADVLLKYVALIILLVVYSYDCFNDVQKNYLKLNKTLFSEVKSRIKDIDKVTSMPAHLQENHGFKSQELSEQAFYEEPDDLVARAPGFWLINDLVLFIDNEDMPRIPLKLFDEVCQIRVAGVPGPVYRGHLMALKRFLKIVLFVFFVFIVVLSFSETYKVSSTNQLLATLAGGFLPLVLRTFMGSGGESELELSTLSFRSKLDEVIKNFHQFWPIYDLPFELEPSQNPVENHMSEVLRRSSLELLKENGKSANEEVSVKTELESGLPHGVTFQEEKSDTVEVDFLIDLPQQNAGLWLEQWSDLGSET